jgi:hypothetical protein
MSRTRNKQRFSRHYRPALLRFLENKAVRRAAHCAVASEARESQLTDEMVEVLADLHEERGHLVLAEQLRRGRNSHI